MLPDLSSAKWSIDDKNKTITIDDISFPVKANDYIGKSEPKYIEQKTENSLSDKLSYLYWILFVIAFFIEKNATDSFFIASVSLIFFVIFSSIFFVFKNIFSRIIFFLLTLFMVFMNISVTYSYRWGIKILLKLFL